MQFAILGAHSALLVEEDGGMHFLPGPVVRFGGMFGYGTGSQGGGLSSFLNGIWSRYVMCAIGSYVIWVSCLDIGRFACTFVKPVHPRGQLMCIMYKIIGF